MLNITKNRKIYFIISGTLVTVSIIFLFLWGLRLGIDFTGGSLLEVRFKNIEVNFFDVQKSIEPLGLRSLIIQPTDNQSYIIRFQDTENEKYTTLMTALKEMAKSKVSDNNRDSQDLIEELRFESIGPSIGKQLSINAIYSIVVVLILIIIYVAWAFRKVSRPVPSWQYGLAGIIALFHDVIITLGAFAFLGKFFNIEVNTPFVAAVLTILGYSINDTIVVFDRIRENLPKSDLDYQGTVDVSLRQTFARSINTSMTVILVLLAITIFGGESIRYFSLALLIGVFFGTYSSIFLASPILVSWEKMRRR